MSALEEVLEANAAYAAAFGSRGELATRPARRFAILTCMDARLDPAKFAGLSEGDAHVILQLAWRTGERRRDSQQLARDLVQAARHA